MRASSESLIASIVTLRPEVLEDESFASDRSLDLHTLEENEKKAVARFRRLLARPVSRLPISVRGADRGSMISTWDPSAQTSRRMMALGTT